MPGLTAAYLRIHPSLTRHLGRRLSAQRRDSLNQPFCSSYLGLLRWMAEREGRSPDQMRALVRCEMPNLRRAMRILLDRQQLSSAFSYAGLWQRAMGELGFQGESARVAKHLQSATAKALPSEGPLGRPGVQFLLHHGEEMLAAGRVGEAGMLLGSLCARMEQEGGLSYRGDDATFDLAQALHQLGRCLHATGRASDGGE